MDKHTLINPKRLVLGEDFVLSTNDKYDYELIGDQVFRISGIPAPSITLLSLVEKMTLSTNGRELLEISFPEEGAAEFSIKDGYAWGLRGAWDEANPDGMTGPMLLLDALYQFRKLDHYPLTRKQIDQLFLQYMEAMGIKQAKSAYYLIRILGWMF